MNTLRTLAGSTALLALAGCTSSRSLASLSLQPRTRAVAESCQTPLPRGQFVPGAHSDLRRAGGHTFLSNTDGTVRDATLLLSGKPPATLGVLPVVVRGGAPLTTLAASADGESWAAVGFETWVSRSGGKEWFALKPPSKETVLAAAFAGDTLVVADAIGGVHRWNGGDWEHLSFPEPTTGMSMAFEDELRGWAVGACGALFATVDGGRSWFAGDGPARSLQSVAIAGGTLWVTSGSGIHRSEDHGRSWQTLVDGVPCQRITAEAGVVVAACSGEGRVVERSDDGATFRALAGSEAFHIATAALPLEGGATLVVGPHDLAARIDASGSATPLAPSPVTLQLLEMLRGAR